MSIAAIVVYLFGLTVAVGYPFYLRLRFGLHLGWVILIGVMNLAVIFSPVLVRVLRGIWTLTAEN